MKIYPVFFLLFLIACNPLKPVILSPSPTMMIHVRGAVLEEVWLEVASFSTFSEVKNQISFHQDADLDAIHPTQILKHGDVIVIPFKSDVPCVSINLASIDQLKTLNGVGEVTASRIIEYRLKQGMFRSLDEIMQVKGIKEKTFLKFKHQLCL